MSRGSGDQPFLNYGRETVQSYTLLVSQITNCFVTVGYGATLPKSRLFAACLQHVRTLYTTNDDKIVNGRQTRSLRKGSNILYSCTT